MKQTCILILGMHRSGTSALSGTLNLLDVYLGSDLMKPHKEVNSKGFYENTLLYKVNKKLLKQIGSSWDDAFYSESKLNSEVDTTELEKVLKQEFQYSQLFAIKDPRLAYLFPLYTKALTNLGIEIKVVIPFRNPLEVADSLRTRNQFSQEKGLLLWAYHFLLSEEQSRDYPRVFTRFDELLQTPQNVIKLMDKRFDLDLASKFVAKEEQVLDFLTPGLKHHNIALDNLSEKMPKIIQDIVGLVPMLNEKDLTIQFDELRTQLFDYQALFYNADITTSLQELEQAKQGLQAKDNELEQAKQGLQAKDNELEQAKQRLQAKDNDLEQIKHELISMYLSKSWKMTRPLRQSKRIFRLKK